LLIYSKEYKYKGDENMEKDFNVKQLDKTTLEFVSKIAWQFEFTCKNTKEGRVMAHAYSEVQKVLQHYIQEIAEC
jgi:histone H3/H4